MAKTNTGNKKGLQAFELLMTWREQGAPAYITAYEAYSLTNGVIGNRHSTAPLRLVDVAAKYAKVVA